MKRIIKICAVFAAAAVLGLGTASCKHGHGGGGGGGGGVYSPGGGDAPVYVPSGGGDGGLSGDVHYDPNHFSSAATTDYTTDPNPTTLEQAVLNEMNFARAHPQLYVTQRLEPLKNGSNIHVDWSTTGTFLTTLQECINEMNAMSPIPELQWGGRLKMSAMEWVTIQGAGTGLEDHGHDRNTWDRMSKYCSYNAAGENLAYGYPTAEDIVIGLLVDDGVANRGHRYNILDYAPKGKDHAGQYTHAGVAYGTHASLYNCMCAINYANGYSEPPLPTP